MINQLKTYFAEEKRRSILFYFWILFLCILCYGILIPTLGFYWDDFPILFSYHSTGAEGFPEFLASDRPLSAWNFMLTTSLFQFNPLGYHLLAFGLRFLSVVLFHQILQTVWPGKSKTAAVAASIFAVYPGFLQQPIALIYCHHLSVFCLFLLSVRLMLKNTIKERFNWFYGLVSWLATLHMFSIENFATLEMIRPVLLWILLTPKYKDLKKRFSATIKIWAPHLVIFTAFIIWRVFIFKFPTYEPDLLEGYEANPVNTLTNLLGRIPRDFSTVNVGAWLDSFSIPVMSDFGINATRLFWILIGVAFLTTFFVLILLPDDKDESKKTKRSIPEIIITALILFFLAASIVWVLELPLEIEFAWDRMTMAFIPAVALLFAGLYALISKGKVIRNLILCLLVSMAVGSHFMNGMTYKRDWEDLQDFFWQLSWRIPELETGTTILGSKIGLDYYSDNSLTAPLNLTYAPDNDSVDLNYLFYYSDVRLGSWLPELEKDIFIQQPYRSYSFSGSTNKIIAIRYNPPGCLQIMDRVYANSITLPNLTETQVDELRLTDLSLIKSEPQNQPLTTIFGSEPEHGWCYYFQKADLARQYGQYEDAAALGEIACEQGLSPRAASEWLPFLESYIWIDDQERVAYLANEINSAEGNYTAGLCTTLERLSNNEEVPNRQMLVEYIKEYNCP